jgi:hypothetical protein
MRQCLIFTASLVTLACAGFAQETRSTIFGRVIDPQNAAVPGTVVMVTNTDTNTSMTLKSNETGYYEASLLLAGNYQVSAEAPGFKKSVRSGIALPVGTRAEIDMRLEIGAAADTVSVTAEAPLVDVTAAATAGRVMDNRNVMDLPTFNNSPLMLIKLVPAVQASNNRR